MGNAKAHFQNFEFWLKSDFLKCFIVIKFSISVMCLSVLLCLLQPDDTSDHERGQHLSNFDEWTFILYNESCRDGERDSFLIAALSDGSYSEGHNSFTTGETRTKSRMEEGESRENHHRRSDHWLKMT